MYKEGNGLKAALILAGIATWYAGPYIGGPLYCGGYYTTDNMPWVAVDVSEYENSRIRCGDTLMIWLAGEMIRARAMDAGPLYKYYIEDFGPELPIVVDIPKHLWPLETLSAKVTIINSSEAYRQLGHLR
jgi:hypothetical protein